ncbi:type II toxin-antitoxin system VapB family antitoxin [Nocardioides daejeonensis]|uniref:type II toxin-antitoxin system VapB family antitoxin n=1 Tax=Nocardioides daejeonensis TaxID=1046556 RepID=UPI000D742317|nr:type II toxin-antitoxin system VapB family antitoxin [Nocardioides daejeonensis]
MSLNIKNERVHRLAREAAQLSGKTQTGAIEAALEEYLAKHGSDPAEADRARRLDLIHRISLSWNPSDDSATVDRIRSQEDLYDPATGLPR